METTMYIIDRDMALETRKRKRARHTKTRTRKLRLRIRCAAFVFALATVLITAFGCYLSACGVTTAYAAEKPDPVFLASATQNVIPETEATSPRKIIETKSYDIPAASTGQKTYMDYHTITNTTSQQYALQQEAYTDELGFRRIDGYYLVAMGTYYAENCGKTFAITFESGETIEVMIGDIKDNRDTDELNQHRNGNVVEFIVDASVIPDLARRMGDMSYADAAFAGNLTTITEIV